MPTVSIKGQIVLPKKIVDTFNLTEGMDLYFKLSEDNSSCLVNFNKLANSDCKSKILTRFQITIPKKIREKMKIELNDRIEILTLENNFELKLADKSWINKAIEFYEDNYSFLGMIDLGKLDSRVFLGEKNECRFCGRKKGEVKFRKEAHAISELLGNHMLFLNDECDDCNQLFSKWENDLGNYLHFWRSATMQAGKRKSPKYKNTSFQMGESTEGRLLIKEFTNNSYTTLNTENKTITIKGVQQSYIPSGVYKSFVKMALSLIPKEQIKNFDKTIEWLLDDQLKIKPNSQLILIEQFVPGPKPYPNVQMLAFSRKTNKKTNNPYYVFLLCYSNFVYQIYVPFCKFDTGLENINVTAFPSNYALVFPEGTIRPDFKDFSSSEKTKKEPISIEFTYDKKIDISPENFKKLKEDFK
ncbi:transcriptional regulator, AbrB family protein [Bacillus cereus H3081.97]|uniref:AbrB/MazE/SpoVT family DNA-binding domain-containing protein n=1 Tax=Bacillus paranthracis TaxID=2026186 RepID=UPI00016B8D10|nr:AbrB/MazE/SpoVT family DNA-binding domain-containing protein [Bacillus paranthracis]EDZ57027.1 transcriptional regulator, AbrB family protein [Bacillus cereus H3081.97]KLA04094.1 hypothetical protein B4086_3438 [Bacillus cereus]